MRISTFFIVVLLLISAIAVLVFNDRILADAKPFDLVGAKDLGRVLGIDELAHLETANAGQTDSSLPVSEDRQSTVPALSPDVKAPELAVASAAVYDPVSGALLYGLDEKTPRPIASLSKLAAVLVVIDIQPDWDSYYEISEEDIVSGGRVYLSAGEQAKVKDLFYLSLVGSANSATEALVGATGLSRKEFISRMNNKAESLGLIATGFNETTGLSAANISTAEEAAKLAAAAFSVPAIQAAATTKYYEFKTLAGRIVAVSSTDSMLGYKLDNSITIVGGKTGFTDAAGYCFAGQFRDEAGHDLITIVLGADDIHARFSETEKLAGWAFQNIVWP